MSKQYIDANEWLAELERLAQEQTDGLSANEIAQLTGRSRKWVLAQLKRLHKQGRIDVGFRMETAIDGKLYRLPVYRLVPRESKPRNTRHPYETYP